jgi:hypothetical protein
LLRQPSNLLCPIFTVQNSDSATKTLALKPGHIPVPIVSIRGNPSLFQETWRRAIDLAVATNVGNKQFG